MKRSFSVLLLVLSVVAGELVMLTPLVQKGQIDQAQAASKITYKNGFYGHAGHFSTPAQHNSSRTNNIYTWYQPCTEGCDEATAPLIIWLQGGPGGPGEFHWFTTH